MKVKEPYNGGKIPDWKLTFIRVNHEQMTATELAKALQISDSKIYSYCGEEGIKPKPNPWYKQNRPPGMKVTSNNKSGGMRYPKEKPKMQRPPAIYSNQNPIDKYL